MRLFLIAIPLALSAAPALAAAPDPVPQLPRALTDPASADKIGHAAGALSKALLDLHVGELQAAVEGRPATAADRRRTLRDVAAHGDPDVERKVERRAAASGAAVQAGMKAMAEALPAIINAVERAGDDIDRATANLPQPGYPRR
jgi:hypothetical protein